MQSHALVILFLFVTAASGLAAAPGIAATSGGPGTAGTADMADMATTTGTAGPSSTAPFDQDDASGATPNDRRVDAPTAGDRFPARESNHTTGSQTSSNTTTDSTTTTNTTRDAPGNGTGDGPMDGNGTGLPGPRDPSTAAVVWVGVVAAVAVGAFFYGRQRQP